jgi:hypothetical protein
VPYADKEKQKAYDKERARLRRRTIGMKENLPQGRPCIGENCKTAPLYFLRTNQPLCPKHYQRFKRLGTWADSAVRSQGNKWLCNKGYVNRWHNGKKIREHRFIMETHLGRKLYPNENVHHRNGIRTDNRVENLELWTKTQPCGQRVTDLIKWAREVLDLYEEKFEREPL